MEKIWLVKQESNVDGELFFNVIPCASLDAAKKVMLEKKRTIFESFRYIGYKDNPEDYYVEESEVSFYIQVNYDDYYEDMKIEEREILS